MEGGADGVIGGVILDESVLFDHHEDGDEDDAFRPAVEPLLRKLRHSAIPTVLFLFSYSLLLLLSLQFFIFSLLFFHFSTFQAISHGVGLSSHKVL